LDKGTAAAADSPIALHRGLDTMLVVAAAHRSSREGRAIALDYEKGCVPEALAPAGGGSA